MYRKPTGVPKKLRNGNIQVRTWLGLFELSSNGLITPDAIEAFTTGHCHSFALALNALTGWSMHASVGYYDSEDAPIHVFVKHPSGRYVDVTGFMKETAGWFRSGEVIRVSKEDIKSFRHYFKPRPTFAMPYASTVLAKIGGMVPAVPKGPVVPKGRVRTQKGAV